MEKHSRIDELNERFGITGTAEVIAGNGGLAKLKVMGPLAAAEIYLHGAQVTAWRPAGEEEVIFLSEHSKWEDGRAIRGGIPVCFPWFRAKADDANAPAHGFVRTKEWNLESVQAAGDGTVMVVCVTRSDVDSRRWWPYEFQLSHRITIGKTLGMELTATNTGSTAFRLEEALHTYFRVGDVAQVEVRGLEGISFLDNIDGNRQKVQAGGLRLSGPVDNAYIDSRGAVEFSDPMLGRAVRTAKENSSTTIVWNPWRQGAAKLADLGDEEWHQMVCVEASNILGSSISLQPGQEHTLRAEIQLIPGSDRNEI
jgi:glucose-6-phosphate 1-epimerase